MKKRYPETADIFRAVMEEDVVGAGSYGERRRKLT